jgi:hypothetical protein
LTPIAPLANADPAVRSVACAALDSRCSASTTLPPTTSILTVDRALHRAVALLESSGIRIRYRVVDNSARQGVDQPVDITEVGVKLAEVQVRFSRSDLGIAQLSTDLLFVCDGDVQLGINARQVIE